ncbi:hypothetical protein QFZ31_005698 [Neobacillus niacini]|jgi:hypothetical protein|nr:hypothetical protein [Neobacillus niacini]
MSQLLRENITTDLLFQNYTFDLGVLKNSILFLLVELLPDSKAHFPKMYLCIISISFI